MGFKGVRFTRACYPDAIELEEQCILLKLVSLKFYHHLLELFSSPEPKAHGELIVYQSSRRVCVSVCVFTFSNMNISETSGPIATKFYLSIIG